MHQTGRVSPRVHRFGLLARLCLALGDHGCASALNLPSQGEAVLCVPYRHRPHHRLAIGAVELNGRWMYTFDGRWSPADELAESTSQVLSTVGAR